MLIPEKKNNLVKNFRLSKFYYIKEWVQIIGMLFIEIEKTSLLY